MKLSTVNPRTAAMLALVLFALSACVVAPAHRHAAYTTYPVYSQPAPPSAVDTVEVAPPVPQVEVIPAVPFARAVWVVFGVGKAGVIIGYPGITFNQ